MKEVKVIFGLIILMFFGVGFAFLAMTVREVGPEVVDKTFELITRPDPMEQVANMRTMSNEGTRGNGGWTFAIVMLVIGFLISLSALWMMFAEKFTRSAKNALRALKRDKRQQQDQPPVSWAVPMMPPLEDAQMTRNASRVTELPNDGDDINWT